MSATRYPVTRGEWFHPRMRGFRLMCCDCALVHVVDIRTDSEGVAMRMRRDDRATAAARRPLKFTNEED